MSENRFIFLKEAFTEFELQFADDFSRAEIVNPGYGENIVVYDDKFEFTVCFSFQHRHFENEDDIIDWIHKIISGNIFAIEFFNHKQRCFGSEIDAEELQGLTYEKLEQFSEHYGLRKLIDVVDSFKIRSWDSKNNFDCAIVREENGTVAISKTFVGTL